ncbi:MAG: hypothetical protein JWO57_804, partial [Pseudonocardiales bacterium]|nr:hypothetical protein [Pseudonocardiales bacterium]
MTGLGNAEQMSVEGVARTYLAVMAVSSPVVRWWGRLEVVGLDLLPTAGP